MACKNARASKAAHAFPYTQLFQDGGRQTLVISGLGSATGQPWLVAAVAGESGADGGSVIAVLIPPSAFSPLESSERSKSISSSGERASSSALGWLARMAPGAADVGFPKRWTCLSLGIVLGAGDSRLRHLLRFLSDFFQGQGLGFRAWEHLQFSVGACVGC